MRLLLINTCGPEGLAALADTALAQPGNRILAEARLPGRGTSESLMPAVARLFAEASWAVSDLSALAVVDGPGSFTGVRVGLSAAKGLCESASIPMVAISRLALVASEFENAAAVLDAGRGEFFFRLDRREILATRDEVLAQATELKLVTSEPRVAEALAGHNIQLIPEPGAPSILAFALSSIEAGDWTDTASADARYLRRTDAELLLDRKNALGQ